MVQQDDATEVKQKTQRLK